MTLLERVTSVCAIWIAMMGAEIVHGALREVFLTPVLGDFRARQVSVLTCSFLVVAIACLGFRWLMVEPTNRLVLIVERFSKENHIHVPLFTSERAKVLRLCLSVGLTVPPHSHAGFDITLQPLKGKALLPIDGGAEVALVPGEIYFVDGAMSFSPRNPFDEDFEMLIHLVRR